MSTFGAMATYTCDEGFNLIGNSTRLCQADGSWKGTDPTCQSELTDLQEIDGSITGDNRGWVIEEYMYGGYHFS